MGLPGFACQASRDLTCSVPARGGALHSMRMIIQRRIVAGVAFGQGAVFGRLWL